MYIKIRNFRGVPNFIVKNIKSVVLFVFLFSKAWAGPPDDPMDALVTLRFKNESLKKVLLAIQAQTKYNFSFGEEVDAIKGISIQVKDRPLTAVLQMLSEQAHVSFLAEGAMISVRRSAFLAKPAADRRQAIKVSGTVTDAETGEILPGVNVAVKGASQGASTDERGNYSLMIEDAETVLAFSFIGYATQEATVGKRTVLDLQLKADQKQLEEVVVLGYGAQARNLLSGSVVSMKMDEARRNTPTTSLGNLLAGQMAGVMADTPNGIPGARPLIYVRTSSSWNGQEALFVIDGKLSSAEDFNNLSPNDIDNISVLKDAASAAAYGARAAGGVIVATTRRGSKNGKPNISYSFSSGAEARGKNAALTSALELGAIYNRLYPSLDKAYTSDDLAYLKNINNGWGYNQLEAVWSSPFTHAHNLSASGGGDKVTYFLSGSYVKQSGFLKNNTYEKYNIRANITTDIAKNLNLFVGLSMNNNVSRIPPVALGDPQTLYIKTLTSPPFQPVFTEAGRPIDSGDNGNLGAEIRGDGGYQTGNDIKPVINAKAVYKIPAVPGLCASLQYNKSYGYERTKKFLKKYDMWGMKTNGAYQISTKDADFLAFRRSAQIAKDNIEEDYNWNHDYQVDFQLNYERTFAAHHINGWMVYEQAGANSGGISGGRETFPVYTVDEWWAASSDRINSWVNGNRSDTYGRKSWVGQVFYEYGKKYIAGVAFRYDASPKFPPDKRWGLFPSASAGWIISRENFFKHAKAIDFLKFRVSAGLTSSDNIGNWPSPDNRQAGFSNVLLAQAANWQWQRNYRQTGAAFFGTDGTPDVGITYGGIPNPNVTWEKTLNCNVAFDINFWEHFNASAEYYYSKTYDILGQRIARVSPTFPRALPNVNYGEIRAKGADFSLGGDYRVGAFAYYAKVNMNYGAPVTIIKDQNVTYPYEDRLGKSLTRIADRAVTGMIRTPADLDAFKKANPLYAYYGHAPELGQLTYEDISGPQGAPDGIINDWDKKTLYENNNPIHLGLNFGGAWKGFTIDVGFAGKTYMKKYMNGLAGGNESRRIWQKMYGDSWTPENPNAAWPKRYRNGDPLNSVNRDGSSFWIKDAGFLRLRLLNMGYNIPESALKKTGISGFKIYFSGSNLFIISEFNDLYYDPELSNGFSYPVIRNFSFGINISL